MEYDWNSEKWSASDGWWGNTSTFCSKGLSKEYGNFMGEKDNDWIIN